MCVCVHVGLERRLPSRGIPDPYCCPWFCTCGSSFVCFLFLSLIVAAWSLKTGSGTMSHLVLELVTGGLYVFVARLMSDKWDEFSGLEGLYVQLAALRSTHNTTISRGLNLFSFSALFSLCVCISLSLSFSLLLLCALTRFSPKLCLGPEWSLCFSHLPYHTSCTTIGGHNVFTMPSGGREHTQIKKNWQRHPRSLVTW